MSKGLGLLQRQILETCWRLEQRELLGDMTYRGGRVKDGEITVRYRDRHFVLPPNVIDLRLAATVLAVVLGRRMGGFDEGEALEPSPQWTPAFSRAVRRLVGEGYLAVVEPPGLVGATQRRFVRLERFPESARNSVIVNPDEIG